MGDKDLNTPEGDLFLDSWDGDLWGGAFEGDALLGLGGDTAISEAKSGQGEERAGRGAGVVRSETTSGGLLAIVVGDILLSPRSSHPSLKLSFAPPVLLSSRLSLLIHSHLCF